MFRSRLDATPAAGTHALPITHRSPAQRLVHAREDHAACLRLAASYRVRMSRGVKGGDKPIHGSVGLVLMRAA